MNRHASNRYEFYELANDWNLTPDGNPHTFTQYIKLDHSITAMKCLYGAPMGEDDDMLVLDRHFGRDYPEVVASFFQLEKLTEQARLELGMPPLSGGTKDSDEKTEKQNDQDDTSSDEGETELAD